MPEARGKEFEEVGKGEGGFAREGPDEARGGEELSDVLGRHGEEDDGDDEGSVAEGEGVGEEGDGGWETGIPAERFSGLRVQGVSGCAEYEQYRDAQRRVRISTSTKRISFWLNGRIERENAQPSP